MSLDEALDRLREADAELAAAGARPFAVPVAGLEAVVAGTVAALDRSDWWVPGLRERAGGVLRGAPVARFVDARSGARPFRVAPSDTSPALRALLAVGLAQAGGGCAAVHLGIGSVADGALYEALNLAALLEVDILFVVAVHPLGDGAPLGAQLASRPVDVARALGITAHEVDGSDAGAVRDTVRAARDAGGPHLIEAALPGPAA